METAARAADEQSRATDRDPVGGLGRGRRATRVAGRDAAPGFRL